MTHPVNGTPRPAALRPGDYLTTGEFADGMGVARRTVTLWADRGLLPGTWRFPNGKMAGERRIPAEAAVALCRQFGRSVPPAWLDCRPVVLLVGLTVAGVSDDYCVRAVADGFEAGIVVQAGGVFACVVVDAATLGSDVARGLLLAMRRHPRLAGVPLSVVVPEDDSGERWHGIADRVLRGPVGAGEVAGVVGGRP